MNSLHRIRRQRWQVRAASPSAAFDLRGELRRLAGHALPQAFERALDALALGDTVLHIPRLELQLHIQELAELEQRLPALIETQLRAALNRSAIGSAASSEPVQVKRYTPAVHRRRLLLDYLLSGRADWTLAAQQHATLAGTLQDEAQVLAAGLSPLAEAHGLPLAARFAFAQRLLALLPTAARARLLPALSWPYAKHTPAAAPLSALQAEAPPPSPAALARTLHTLLSLGVLDTALQLQLQALLLSLGDADCHTAPYPALVRTVLQGCAAALQRHAAPQQALSATAWAVLDLQTIEKRAAPPLSQSSGNAPASPSAATTQQPPRSKPAASNPQPAAQFVYAAGLLLLHPYLPRLFSATGLTTEAARRLPDTNLPRAAALLHWLASGRDQLFEFELDFIKLLLGQSPDAPLLVAPGLLSDDDRAEGEALLAAVVEHWGALGHTSPDGLRLSFLQRRGLLSEDARGWQVHLEPESFDMLLARLPWAISIVKLPWMTRPIFTEWPTP